MDIELDMKLHNQVTSGTLAGIAYDQLSAEIEIQREHTIVELITAYRHGNKYEHLVARLVSLHELAENFKKRVRTGHKAREQLKQGETND